MPSSNAHPLVSKAQWRLTPELHFLNHGSFGACPEAVLRAQAEWRERMERSPVAFFLRVLPEAIDRARHRLSEVIEAPEAGLVFVSNASEGVSTVLHHIDWRPDDEVVISDHGYPACRHMLSALEHRYGVRVRVASVPFSIRSTDDHDGERSSMRMEPWRRAVCAAFESALSSKTKLMLIDHITSPTGLVFPVDALLSLARSRGVLSLVDGAHAPGHVPLSIESLKPDFYVGNLHKWLFTPRSCGFLYVGEAQRAHLKPLTISHGYLSDPPRLLALFDWTGTRDYTPVLCLPQALDWVRETIGDLDTLMAHNRHLALSARHILMETLWPEGGPPLPPEEAIGALATIPLPSRLTSRFNVLRSDMESPSANKERAGASASIIHPLQDHLFQHNIEVPIISWTPQGAEPTLMVRISAQVYNTLDEYRALAQMLCK
jgi:isopenicillin-N epimerase